MARTIARLVRLLRSGDGDTGGTSHASHSPSHTSVRDRAAVVDARERLFTPVPAGAGRRVGARSRASGGGGGNSASAQSPGGHGERAPREDPQPALVHPHPEDGAEGSPRGGGGESLRAHVPARLA